MKIDYSEQMLTWKWNGSEIKIELPEIIHAEYHKDEKMVMVYSGENFISKTIFYFIYQTEYFKPSMNQL